MSAVFRSSGGGGCAACSRALVSIFSTNRAAAPFLSCSSSAIGGGAGTTETERGNAVGRMCVLSVQGDPSGDSVRGGDGKVGNFVGSVGDINGIRGLSLVTWGKCALVGRGMLSFVDIYGTQRDQERFECGGRSRPLQAEHIADIRVFPGTPGRRNTLALGACFVCSSIRRFYVKTTTLYMISSSLL
jgi:hypothetical protein